VAPRSEDDQSELEPAAAVVVVVDLSSFFLSPELYDPTVGATLELDAAR
jgi:hypothetical protein